MDDATEALITQVAERAADRAVMQTFITFGVDITQPIEAQKDMAALRELRQILEDPELQRDLVHLRTWRKTMDAVQSRGTMAAIGLMTLGGAVFIYMGVKTKFLG